MLQDCNKHLWAPHSNFLLWWSPKVPIWVVLAFLMWRLFAIVSPVNTPTSSTSFKVICCCSLGHSSSRAALCCQSVSGLARQSGQAGCLQSFQWEEGTYAWTLPLFSPSPAEKLVGCILRWMPRRLSCRGFHRAKKMDANPFRGRVRVLQENHLDL